ncbi:hypothetical protein [Phenylobacterium sp.]|uniref:hypothetical protein n=1 Tax=Phenylobacterium sp. TaxID=1871053 RepID=UPI0027342345|nr:hypothetical protein [Phenylobacterium sp.]MDP3594597.1 hypothetical protein [Phenylobacterium sp.]
MRSLITVSLGLALFAGPAFAQDSVANASAAGGASSEVVTHLAASGVQTVVGVAAVPVSVAAGASAVGGSAVTGAGAGSVQVGADMSEAAGDSAKFASGKLKVDDRVVVSPDPAPAVPYDVATPAAR